MAGWFCRQMLRGMVWAWFICPERATEGSLRGAESGKVPPYIEDMEMFYRHRSCWSGIVWCVSSFSWEEILWGLWYGDLLQSGMYEVCLQLPARLVSGLRRCEYLIRNARPAQGVQRYRNLHFIWCFAPTRSWHKGATPDIRSPAYLNKTRGIDCVLWCEIVPWSRIRRIRTVVSINQPLRESPLRIYQCLRTISA